MNATMTAAMQAGKRVVAYASRSRPTVSLSVGASLCVSALAGMAAVLLADPPVAAANSADSVIDFLLEAAAPAADLQEDAIVGGAPHFSAAARAFIEALSVDAAPAAGSDKQSRSDWQVDLPTLSTADSVGDVKFRAVVLDGSVSTRMSLPSPSQNF